LRLAEVRLRIPIVLLAAALVVGRWDTIANYWDRLVRRPPVESITEHAVSSNTEYFCPMDPGVVSDWPGRCGVCNMALVRRKRGEAIMLPDGVVARMQLSPYRIQLAGIQTSPVVPQALEREWASSGAVERTGEGAAVVVDLAQRQAPWVGEGDAVGVACPDLPGQAELTGRVRSLGSGAHDESERAQATIVIEKPPPALRPGMIAVVRFHVRVAALDPFRAMARDAPALKPGESRRVYACPDHPEALALQQGRCPIDGNDREIRALSELERLRWWCPMHPGVTSEKPGAVCQPCGGMELRPTVVFYLPVGQVLAVPRSAVIDSGARKVVFVATMPGMFDGVEVTLGPRCGDFYPVVSGLQPGQRVATAGAFLLDAETRLNPSLAAAYFGAARGERPSGRAAVTGRPAAVDKQSPEQAGGLEGLELDDRSIAMRQQKCPVTGLTLGSMGTPKRKVVSGRVVFLCCDGCEGKLLREPAKYLAKLREP
jgi:hypothetical protein